MNLDFIEENLNALAERACEIWGYTDRTALPWSVCPEIVRCKWRDTVKSAASQIKANRELWGRGDFGGWEGAAAQAVEEWLMGKAVEKEVVPEPAPAIDANTEIWESKPPILVEVDDALVIKATEEKNDIQEETSNNRGSTVDGG